jgi:hypothetical protein
MLSLSLALVLSLLLSCSLARSRSLSLSLSLSLLSPGGAYAGDAHRSRTLGAPFLLLLPLLFPHSRNTARS